MNQPNVILSIHDLFVSYSGVPALEGVSLSVKQGQITTIVGANGAGKTTLMKAVAGLLTPSKGKIEFRGQDITGLSPAQTVSRGLTLVPEGRRLFPTMNIRDNLMSGAYVRSDKEAIEKDLETVLDYFPILKDRLHMPANSLSGGQQQMLAVGRALMASPRLLMLDEPSIGLAPNHRGDDRQYHPDHLPQWRGHPTGRAECTYGARTRRSGLCAGKRRDHATWKRPRIDTER